jgi:hypothetical protein
MLFCCSALIQPLQVIGSAFLPALRFLISTVAMAPSDSDNDDDEEDGEEEEESEEDDEDSSADTADPGEIEAASTRFARR